MDYYDYAPAYVTEDSVPVVTVDCAEPLGR